MKKSQRLRLAELLAKDQATLAATEKTELASLQGLATQHPDAAKDTADEPAAAAAVPAAATGFKSALMGALATLREKAAVGADLASARTDLTAARATIATLTTERDQARADTATAQASMASISAEFTAFAGYFGIKVSDCAGKDAAAVHGLLAQKISIEAAEQVAALGQPMTQLPKQTASGAAEPTTLAEHIAHFNTLAAGKERDEYYARHLAPAFKN